MAITDPLTRTIHISREVGPPLLDMVLLYEVAHAITVSYGLLHVIRSALPPDLWLVAEEFTAELVEKHGVEAAIITSQALGRPLCISGFCV